MFRNLPQEREEFRELRHGCFAAPENKLTDNLRFQKQVLLLDVSKPVLVYSDASIVISEIFRRSLCSLMFCFVISLIFLEVQDSNLDRVL
jgi:hypothetical protein